MTERWQWASYERVREAAEELKTLIRARYPDAEFRLVRDPNQQRSWFLRTMVDVDDPEDVSRLVVDREVDMLAEEHIPLHVLVTERDSPRVKATAMGSSRASN